MNKARIFILCLISITVSCQQQIYTGNEIKELNARLTSGWNTWNSSSVLSHVLLPECFAISLQLVNSQSGDTLKEALIGRSTYDSKELVTAGPRSYDGSYTELIVDWQGIKIQVQSAAAKEDLFLLVTPENFSPGDALLLDPQILWGNSGEIEVKDDRIIAETPTRRIELSLPGAQLEIVSGNIRVPLNEPIAISTDASKSMEELEKIIANAKTKAPDGKFKFSKTLDSYNAMQRVLAWNTTYDPENNRIISPVSRTWSAPSGGWVLFEWDTYFAAYMFALDCKDLAYANAIAITSEMTDRGFVPNNTQPAIKSLDRSQPPVGAFVVKEIYKNWKEKWFLHELFDDLLTWNRWWAENRDIDGYLSYGSDPYDWGPVYHRSYRGFGNLKGAKWESGLDNSPMYDDVEFDTTKHQMLLADVGLMSLYINECHSLSEIAGILGKTEIQQELTERAERYSKNLQTLWNEDFGLFLNKDLATGEFSYRLSPTLFYPLLAKVPGQEQATRMMKEHFYNPEEFWGEFIMPSIARNDSAFKDNRYWRGRIWAPMNFLVYLGIRNYDLPEAQKDMAVKSANLLLKSWLTESHVYENYNAEHGQGDDDSWSDKFYHWGALLGFIGIMEEGYVAPPELSLKEIK